ncbi:type IV pilus modification PilV family protein [Vibrio aestuarianus]|uniref:type IV pilus modification PilV family protein n=1 Tax=Vibrio aestuarianus TaxID=28171 RepID=UPI0014483A61|nr:type II secretion system protein [Vibrio aestuarianus]MDE1212910.1 type II secretion system GspH family protein [Vibrio aestuarianus]MDE1217940.1 type II secretion system GspH family protein [Vibrio aestuarianus]MDE1260038.1 type II secretion system GspH family protein [Vibrio aestuarianus]MDE1268252.1 type II secretion system GspH family protein [Vibrio aestuarianus]MDE1274280.1 type II secretion system GspH family protein [Vibrio aestuarianus]
MAAKRTTGFTLIEMIIVITLIAIAMTGITAALYPRSQQSAEQVLAVKAAELGRAVLDEVMGRAFDENSDPNGGVPECVLVATTGRKTCTLPIELGRDAGENANTLYNDVDDFDGLTGSVKDVLGADISADYQRYNVEIKVFYEQNNGGVMTGQDAATITDYKRISVVIIDPSGNRYPFAATRGNF